MSWSLLPVEIQEITVHSDIKPVIVSSVCIINGHTVLKESGLILAITLRPSWFTSYVSSLKLLEQFEPNFHEMFIRRVTLNKDHSDIIHVMVSSAC
jgi:hypothetical protein